MEELYLVPVWGSGLASASLLVRPQLQIPLSVKPEPLSHCDLRGTGKATEPWSCHILPTPPVLSFQFFQIWLLSISCVISGTYMPDFVTGTGIPRLPALAAYSSQPCHLESGWGWRDGCLLANTEACPLSPRLSAADPHRRQQNEPV